MTIISPETLKAWIAKAEADPSFAKPDQIDRWRVHLAQLEGNRDQPGLFRDNGRAPKPETFTFERFLAHLHQGGTYGCYFITPGERHIWFSAGKPSRVPTEKVNVYYCVNPMTQQKRSIKTTAAVNCLYADFDSDKPGILAHINRLPLVPSVVIDSGGGCHCYWLLTKSFILTTDDDRERAKRTQATWVAFVGGDNGAKDLARVLRVPGTKNYKDKYAPNFPTVTVVKADLDQVYSLSELEALLPESEPESKAKTKTQSTETVDPVRKAKYWQQALENAADMIRQTQDGHKHETLLKAARLLGGYVAGGLGNEQDATVLLESEIEKKANVTDLNRARKTIRDGIAYGQNAPITYDDLEAGRMAWLEANGYADLVDSYTPDPDRRVDVLIGEIIESAGNQSRGVSEPAEPQPLTVRPALSTKNPWLPREEVERAAKRGEVGDAELFAQLYRNRLVYDHAESQWYLWNGQHWESDRCNYAVNLVSNQLGAQYLHIASLLKNEIEATEDNDVIAAKAALAKILTESAGALLARRRINNVLALAASQYKLAKTGDEWDAHPWLLGVKNGTVDLRNGAFRAGQPGDYIRTVAPIDWQGLDAPAQRWKQFLDEIFDGDAELVSCVQRLMGYGVTGLAYEHVLPVLWGAGRNGKDTLLEAITSALGDLAKPVGVEVLLSGGRNPNAASPHLYGLRSLRVAFVSETNEGARLDAGQVKLLTGGGRIPCRPLYGKPIEFDPHYLLMLITNFKPHVSADDYAMWKRLLLIPFKLSFVDEPQEEHERKRDPLLGVLLKSEAAGILAWLVRGCLEWQRQGLNPPEVVRAATQAYQEEEDALGQWIAACCILKDGSETKAKTLYSSYDKWCFESGIKKPMSMVTWGKKMKKRFGCTEGAYVYYQGIGLLTEDEPPTDIVL